VEENMTANVEELEGAKVDDAESDTVEKLVSDHEKGG